MKAKLFVLFMLLAIFASAACGSPAPIAQTAPQSPSVIKLVENNDDVKNVYTTYRGDGGYEDVSLEEGIAEVQFLCSDKQSFTFSVGVASTLNTSELTVTDCPALLTGVHVQIVNTSTHYGFDCRNCTIVYNGEWEYGEGVSAWRGTVTITKTGTESPSLYLVPISQP